MSVILNPFQLLEINVISAQDLAGVSRSMRTYAVAWVNPDRKLSTRVDSRGHNNPTWNDKFVFRVDDHFLRSDTSAITIEIHALNWLNDVHVGTVRVLVGNLIPPPPPVRRPQSNHHYALRVGMRFIALQVRRPSGRPQGILNVGVSLLDSSMRSMPLSAVGFHDDHRPTDKNHHHPPHDDEEEEEEEPHTPHSKINKYRRSRSERSARVSDLEFNDDQKKPGSGSTVNESEFGPPTPERAKTGNKKKGKASSIAGGSDARKGKREGGGRGSSMVSGSSVSVFRVVRRKKKNNNNTNKKKNGSDVGPDPPGAKGKKMNGSTVSGSWACDPPAESIINGSDVGYSPKYRMITDKPIRIHPTSRLVGGGKGGIAEFAPPQRKPNNSHNHRQGPNYWTASEVGPSASEVAAAVAEGTYPQDDGRSSVLDKWSLDGSTEGLRSKLERWRTELPPLYDRGSEYAASYPASSVAAGGRRGRRHSAPADGGGGPFRCIGNIFGYECSCVCGRDASPRKKNGSSQRSSRRVSSSIVSGSYV